MPRQFAGVALSYALYAVLLGVTVLLVILASSIALVYELGRFQRRHHHCQA